MQKVFFSNTLDARLCPNLSSSEGKVSGKLSFWEGKMREIVAQKVLEGTVSPIPPSTRRDIRVPKVPNKAFAVIGMRRAGKTTFLWQIAHERMAQGATREQVLYFNFEDERLTGLEVSQLHWIVEEYYRLYPHWRDQERVIFLLDEIQIVSGWERFARRLMDTEQIDLYLSGSSAKLLSQEIASSMRGRALPITVFPFSFREYLRHLNIEPERPYKRLRKAEQTLIEHHLRRYLRVGGFPEVVSLDSEIDRMELLRTYVDVAVLRDVIERHDIKQVQALRRVVRRLLSAPAGTLSVNKLYNELKSQGIKISKETLYSYLDYLTDAFLVRIVELSSRSERQRMSNPRKVYPIDMGLIPLYQMGTEFPLGQAVETCVLLELQRRKGEGFYVKTPTGYEVDFLVYFPEGYIELIQVCANPSEPATLEREVRALLDAKTFHPNASLRLVVLESLPLKVAVPEEIQVSLLSEWLLMEQNCDSVP